MAVKISSQDKKDIDTIIKSIESKAPIELYYDSFTDARLVELLKKLRSINYRVFLGKNEFGKTLVTTTDYINQMNYKGSIQNNGEDLKICVISDLHLGSIFDEPRYIDRVWDFCTACGIHHIINLGDIVEGSEYMIDNSRNFESYRPEIQKNLDSQICYLNNNIPYDKNITHHLLFGNHDLYSSNGISLDVVKELEERYSRQDIKVCGIEDTKFQVNNDYLHLFHHSFNDIIRPYVKKFEDSVENEVILSGHSHISKSYNGIGYDLECVPTLSKQDHHYPGFEFFSGFIVVTISFNENLQMQNINLKRYRLDDSYNKPAFFHDHNIKVRRLIKED